MKRYFSILLFVLALSLLSALAACKGVETPAAESNAETLPALQAPQNIRLAETQDAILWDAVEGAKGYTVIYNGGSEERVPVNKYYLEPVTAETTVTLQVKANGDSTANGDSAWATQTVTVTPKQQTVEAPTAGLEYELLPDGTYEVSCPSKYFKERIVIPDTYKGIPITRIAESAFSYFKDYDGDSDQLYYYGGDSVRNQIVKSVRFPIGLQEIGHYAFWGCTNLEKIDLPNTLSKIGGYAFFNCQKITQITLPETVAINAFAFSKTSIQHLTIPENVTFISVGAFSGCDALESVTMLGNRKSVVQDLFRYCRLLKSVILPDSIQMIGAHAFSECNHLTSIHFPASLIEIGIGAFSGSGLEAIQLPDSVCIIGGYAFADSQLTSIQVPKTLIEIKATAFQGTPWYKAQSDGPIILCDDILLLWNQEMPDGFEITAEMLKEVRYIAGEAFSNCKQLKSITIPKGVSFVGSKVFYQCTALETVQLPIDLPVIYRETFYDCKSLTRISIPNGTKLAGDKIFYGCKALCEVLLPADLMVIPNNTFSGCGKLLSIQLPKTITSVQVSAVPRNIVLYCFSTTLDEALNLFDKSDRVHRKNYIYLYSESKPTQPGNYWHYDETGAPVQWEPVEG